MKFSSTLAALLLVVAVSFTSADDCYDKAAVMKKLQEHGMECQSANQNVKGREEKMKAIIKCCLTNHGVLDSSENVNFDKLLAFATEDTVSGKTEIVKDGFKACKDKFSKFDEMKGGLKCVCKEIENQCSDVKKFVSRLH